MASIVPFEALRENQRYYEEFDHGSACIPCSVIRRLDAEHVQMFYGEEQAWTQTTKKNTQFRYWNDVPTENERKAYAW